MAFPAADSDPIKAKADKMLKSGAISPKAHEKVMRKAKKAKPQLPPQKVPTAPAKAPPAKPKAEAAAPPPEDEQESGIERA